MSKLSADNPVGLITGGAKRVGAAITRALHSAGFSVVIHYRNSASAAQELAAELNAIRDASAITLAADFDKPDQPAALAADINTVCDRLDLLVNNASTFYPTPIAGATEQDWDQLFNSNLKTPFFLSQALAPLLKAANGSIINLIDIHAERPLPEHSIYCMAKAGLQMMTKSLAQELGPDIRVNGIAPGAILWPGGDSLLDSAEEQQSILSRVPLARIGDPQDIAELVVFLAQQAAYISGQIIAVDGGRTTFI